MRVFLTGGTGLIGARLTKLLLERGDQPVVLTRRYGPARQQLGPKVELIEGDPMRPGPWMESVDGCDAAVHLAGENVFGRRWNAAFKQLLVDSRVQGTKNVVEALLRKPKRADGQPKVLVNASAIGFYGPRGDEEVDENAAPGHDFLADLCVEWEKAAHGVEAGGVRLAVVRVGVVLDPNGGALAKLLTPFKLFAGGPVAGGRQWMSWAHHDDMTGLFLFALDNPEARGPLNGTAPNPVTNRDFATALGHALNRPSFFPTPGFVLRVMLGEAAHIVVTGQRVVPRRPLALGHAFKYPTVEAALGQIFSTR
jgi:uncharacterized protein (TIGR01777 family)